MHAVRSFLVVAAAAAILVVVSPSLAKADEADQLTYLRFNAPVEVPGVVLPAGSYMFEVADGAAEADIVRVYSRDGSKLFSTFLAIPVEREKVTARPVIVLEKGGPQGPEAVKSWFYPDDLVGHMFVYPKPEARMIAEANRTAKHRAG